MPARRKAELVLTAGKHKLRRDLQSATKDIHTFGRTAGGKLRSAFSASVGNLATLGTAAGLAAIGKEVLQVEETLTRMGIQAGRSGAELDDFVQGFGKSASMIGLDFGMTKESVTGAADALVNLMGAEAASVENMRLLAKASTATGAAVGDLAGTFYALDNAFGFENAATAEKALSGVIEAGKQGSIPLAEMSSVLQQQATSLAKITDNAGDAASVLQIVRRGFGSAAEAGTGVKSLVTTLEGAAPKLRALGIRVQTKDADGNRVLRDLDDILDQVEKHDLFNSRNYTWAIGSAEARKSLEMLVQHREKLDEIREAARRSNAVQEDSAAFLQTNAGRMRLALAKVRHEVESVFTPERLERFTEAAETLAGGLSLVIDHSHELFVAFGAIYALRFAAKIATWSRAILAFNKGVTDGAAGLDGLASKSGKLGKLASTLNKLGAVAAAATAGWTVGTMIAEATGIGQDTSAKTELDAWRRNLQEQRTRLADQDALVADLARPGALQTDLVPGARSSAAARQAQAIARKVQDGTATEKEQLFLSDMTLGRFVFEDSGLKNRKGDRVFNSRRDLVKDVRALEVRIAQAEANERNAQRLTRWDDESAMGGVARELLRGELGAGGDKRISGDEIAELLRSKGLLMELALNPHETTEMSLSRMEQANRELIQQMARMVEQQMQLYGAIGKDIVINMDGHKLIEATANSPHAARSVAE